ncbi:hypothetical protein HDK77DRAFT_144015 [Phyllosticta capitalensis]
MGNSSLPVLAPRLLPPRPPGFSPPCPTPLASGPPHFAACAPPAQQRRRKHSSWVSSLFSFPLLSTPFLPLLALFLNTFALPLSHIPPPVYQNITLSCDTTFIARPGTWSRGMIFASQQPSFGSLETSRSAVDGARYVCERSWVQFPQYPAFLRFCFGWGGRERIVGGGKGGRRSEVG